MSIFFIQLESTFRAKSERVIYDISILTPMFTKDVPRVLFLFYFPTAGDESKQVYKSFALPNRELFVTLKRLIFIPMLIKHFLFGIVSFIYPINSESYLGDGNLFSKLLNSIQPRERKRSQWATSNFWSYKLTNYAGNIIKLAYQKEKLVSLYI